MTPRKTAVPWEKQSDPSDRSDLSDESEFRGNQSGLKLWRREGESCNAPSLISRSL